MKKVLIASAMFSIASGAAFAGVGCSTSVAYAVTVTDKGCGYSKVFKNDEHMATLSDLNTKTTFAADCGDIINFYAKQDGQTGLWKFASVEVSGANLNIELEKSDNHCVAYLVS